MYQKNKKVFKKELLLAVAVLIVLTAGLLFLNGCRQQEAFYVEKSTNQMVSDGPGVSESSTKEGGSAGENSSAGENGLAGENSSAGENGSAGKNGLAGENGSAGENSPAEDVTDNSKMIYVQVAGAVAKPGVYQLPAGSRIFQAIELAGGVTEEADIASVNQAQVLSDGQMIYMYTVGEQKRDVTGGEDAAGEKEAEDGRVNLNTATAEQLMTLPGIGQAKAESIISFREAHGGFSSVEDIMNIEGIKEGVFSKIKDRIKVN